MPRGKTPVKNKSPVLARSIGVVDLHFHGAFGIDLFSASRADFEALSAQLWSQGIAAFCPTTLSSEKKELREAVQRIGEWIRSGEHPGAIPLGIHLEGPFISPHACGAHPQEAIRPLDFDELDSLWVASRQTLKILTFALEQVPEDRFSELAEWCRKRKIVLSLGHTRAQEEQLKSHFLSGDIRGITHAWNAMSFHHRAPGPLGAALGCLKTHVELILDQVHVSPRVIQWTKKLHAAGWICYVSDCVPAAGLPPGRWYPFGSLQVEATDAGCRLKNGALAGGAKLLSQSFAEWVEWEARDTGLPLQRVLKVNLRHITEHPLRALDLPQKVLRARQVSWAKKGGRLQAFPVDSPSASR